MRSKAQAQALGIADRCAWLGAQPQKAVFAALARADLFVLASKNAADGDQDGLPNVLMEAAHQGLPIVSTRAAAIAEFIEDGANGLLVPPGAPDELAAALERLVRDPALRRRFAEAPARPCARASPTKPASTGSPPRSASPPPPPVPRNSARILRARSSAQDARGPDEQDCHARAAAYAAEAARQPMSRRAIARWRAASRACCGGSATAVIMPPLSRVAPGVPTSERHLALAAPRARAGRSG